MSGSANLPDNRQKTDKKRAAPKTAFAPGQSGNPGGRPKRTEEELNLITACKEKSAEALVQIEELMKNGKQDSVRLQAAIHILDRAYGKSVDKSDVKLTGTVSMIYDTTIDPEEAYKKLLHGKE